MIKQIDIELIVNDFKKKSKPDDRYTSFDYCYNYFRTTKDLTIDIEKSCLVLGFYLASWGMLRGSSFLLQKSAKHFESTIRYINSLDKNVWDIDVDKYNEENIEQIIEIYNKIKKELIPNGNTDLTLVTKVLLGVFGFIPAFDSYFCETFRTLSDGKCGFRRVNKDSLDFIKEFYEKNKISIDNLSNNTFTTDFISEKKNEIKYPKAKIIDMYGFNKSNFSTTEKVFELLGEGGSICISRQKNNMKKFFTYTHNEFDFMEEELSIDKKVVYPSFEKLFEEISNKYAWYMLHIETIHQDYRKFIIHKLIEELNKNSISANYLETSKTELEEKLAIKLTFNFNNDETIWKYIEN